MTYKRQINESKKQYYQKIRKIKRQQYADFHKNILDQNIKSHFPQLNSQSINDDKKSKKITKNESKIEQRLRNRVAAQESRQKHRFYVQQLEQKVKRYQQIFQGKKIYCQKCQNQINNIFYKDKCQSFEESQRDKNSSTLARQDFSVDNFFNQQIIRIQNVEGSSPYSIFYLISFIGLIAFVSMQLFNDPVSSRILTNFENFETRQNKIYNNQKHLRSSLNQIKPKYLFQESKIDANIKKICPYHHEKFESINLKLKQRNQQTENWTKIGKYICSQPKLLFGSNQNQYLASQYLLIKTGKYVSNSSIQDIEQQLNYKILDSNQESMEISSCILQSEYN